jgi:hypothetical protein
MRHDLGPGISALLDPADEPYLRLLENCARARRDLGLPHLSRSELEALLDRPDRRVRDLYGPNVIPLRAARRRMPSQERPAWPDGER